MNLSRPSLPSPTRPYPTLPCPSSHRASLWLERRSWQLLGHLRPVRPSQHLAGFTSIDAARPGRALCLGRRALPGMSCIVVDKLRDQSGVVRRSEHLDASAVPHHVIDQGGIEGDDPGRQVAARDANRGDGLHGADSCTAGAIQPEASATLKSVGTSGACKSARIASPVSRLSNLSARCMKRRCNVSSAGAALALQPATNAEVGFGGLGVRS